MIKKKEVTIDITDLFEKYNSMFVVTPDIFKKRAREIIKDHLTMLESSINSRQKNQRNEILPYPKGLGILATFI